jgi:hypothetical protein
MMKLRLCTPEAELLSRQHRALLLCCLEEDAVNTGNNWLFSVKQAHQSCL